MANIINIGGGANGGGSSVVPNPQGTATDTLVKLGIEGTIYDFEGGGSGSGYSETTLWSGSETPSTNGTQITLSDNISNYDEIVFVMDTDYGGSNSFLVSQLEIGEIYIATIYAPLQYGAYWSYDSDTQVTIKSQASAQLKTYTKVIGIKYGGGAGHTYSTTEQIVGKWIDGKTLYEKTFTVSNVTINTSDWQNIEQIADIDKLVSTDGVVTILFNGQQTGVGPYFNVSVNSSGYVRFICTTWNNETADVVVTLRYTKSST